MESLLSPTKKNEPLMSKGMNNDKKVDELDVESLRKAINDKTYWSVGFALAKELDCAEIVHQAYMESKTPADFKNLLMSFGANSVDAMRLQLICQNLIDTNSSSISNGSISSSLLSTNISNNSLVTSSCNSSTYNEVVSNLFNESDPLNNEKANCVMFVSNNNSKNDNCNLSVVSNAKSTNAIVIDEFYQDDILPTTNSSTIKSVLHSKRISIKSIKCQEECFCSCGNCDPTVLIDKVNLAKCKGCNVNFVRLCHANWKCKDCTNTKSK